MTPGSMDNLSMAPSDYFRRQIYACFWFERSGIAEAIESVGADHLMFETDFPHPTCIVPRRARLRRRRARGRRRRHHRRDHGPQRGPPLPDPAACLTDVIARLAAAGCVAPEDEARELCLDAPDPSSSTRGCVAARPANRWPGSSVGPGSVVWTCTSRPASTSRAARDGRAGAPAPPTCSLRAGVASISARGVAQSPRGCSTSVRMRSSSVSTSISWRRGARRATVCAVVVGDLAAPSAPAGAVDVVTAVAPYVPTAERRLLPVDVQRHEPALALDGGDDGLAVVRRVVEHASQLLRAGGICSSSSAVRRTRRSRRTSIRERFTSIESWHDDDGDLRGLITRRATTSARHG